MTATIRGALALFFCWLVLPPPGTGAQEDAPDFPDQERGVSALIRGRVITRFDLAEEDGRLVRTQQISGEAPEELRYQWVRARLAERLLLLETARRFTADVTDEEVRRYYTTHMEMAPDMVEARLEELKDRYVIRLYMGARLGWTERAKGVLPDVAPFARVTAEDIRSHYRNHIEDFTTPGCIEVIWVLLPEMAFPSAALRRELAEECRGFLEKGAGLDDEQSAFAEARRRWPGCLPRKQALAPGEEYPFDPAVAQFVKQGSEGEVSGIIELEAGAMVARVHRIVPESTRTFDEVQHEVAADLRNFRENMAEQFILEELRRSELLYWPDDLFQDAARPRTGGIPAPGAPPGR